LGIFFIWPENWFEFSLGSAAVNINKRDLIQLRKDIERVRKHEEARRVQQATEESAGSSSSPARKKIAPQPSGPVAVKVRRMLEALCASTSPSKESLEAIPEHVVTLLQIIREEPKFERWLLAIEALPVTLRNEQLRRMSFAFRIEDEQSTIAESFDRLRENSLFKAFCQALRDEKQNAA
jgi:hypothetical protein